MNEGLRRVHPIAPHGAFEPGWLGERGRVPPRGAFEPEGLGERGRVPPRGAFELEGSRENSHVLPRGAFGSDVGPRRVIRVECNAPPHGAFEPFGFERASLRAL